MTMHPTPAERLLAMLADDGAIESLAASEVRHELAAMGLDPARSVAFAKSLAQGDTPGGKLMEALLAGEADEREIARIEAADIEEVRAAVDRGTAAAIAAEARRRAGRDDKVVGLEAQRRRRRRLIAWGGPLAGIAASFLVVVIGLQMLKEPLKTAFDNESAYRPNLSREADEAPRDVLADKSDDAAGLAKEKSATGNELSSATNENVALNQPPNLPPPAGKRQIAPAAPDERQQKQEQFAATPLARLDDKDIAAAKPSAEKKTPGEAAESPPSAAATAPEPESAAPESNVADAPPSSLDSLGGVAGGEKADREPADQRRAEVARSSDSGSYAETATPSEGDAAGAVAEAETEAPALPSTGTGVGLLRNVEISEIAAVLVVDRTQASMQIQSQILPSGDLPERVEEAQRLAGGRPVIALYTIATGENRQDFAQVPLQAGFSQQLAAPAPLIGLLGVEATAFDFIALPPE